MLELAGLAVNAVILVVLLLEQQVVSEPDIMAQRVAVYLDAAPRYKKL